MRERLKEPSETSYGVLVDTEETVNDAVSAASHQDHYANGSVKKSTVEDDMFVLLQRAGLLRGRSGQPVVDNSVELCASKAALFSQLSD